MTLFELIKKHEGLSLKLYQDIKGYWTIGYGRNLSSVGISSQEAEFLLKNDIAKATKNVELLISNYSNLSLNRQNALIDMMFNLGLSKFRTFYSMLKAITEERFEDAAKHMLDSKWATQVGNRAKEDAELMKNNCILDGF